MPDESIINVGGGADSRNGRYEALTEVLVQFPSAAIEKAM